MLATALDQSLLARGPFDVGDPSCQDLSKDEAGFRVAKEFPVECWRCGLNISSASSKSCSLQELLDSDGFSVFPEGDLFS